MAKHQQIVIRVTDEMRAWLDEQAASDYRTMSSLVGLILERAKREAELNGGVVVKATGSGPATARPQLTR